jgi:MFS transporter, DHA2 family, multidrug resistance protein
MFLGLGVMAIVTWQIATVDVYTSKFWLSGVLAAWGLGAGLVIGPALMTIFEGLPIDETTMLAGVFNIMRSIPAFIATVTLMTLWTQSTDAQFDTLRQNIRYNRPVVSESYGASQQHFTEHGSPHDESVRQSQALAAKWTHANARAFALQEVLRVLAIFTAMGLIPVILLRRPHAATERRMQRSPARKPRPATA